MPSTFQDLFVKIVSQEWFGLVSTENGTVLFSLSCSPPPPSLSNQLGGTAAVGTVRVFGHICTLDDAIGSHACSA
jgi:hypothetical protein